MAGTETSLAPAATEVLAAWAAFTVAPEEAGAGDNEAGNREILFARRPALGVLAF